VLLVDDHPLVLDGLRTLIERDSDLAVCGVATSGAEALAVLDGLGPDLVILDLSLRDTDGTRLIRRILERSPKVPVLVLSVYEEEIYAERCLRAGARGYLNKRTAGEEVRRAIRALADGELYLADSTQALRPAAPASHSRRGSTESGPETLSDRELELFQLLGRGLKPSQIAQAMDLSVKTVEGYAARIEDKLGLAGIDDLRRIAADWCRRRDR
jgi:DNA-binding NarL/FixJ family response regulator